MKKIFFAFILSTLFLQAQAQNKTQQLKSATPKQHCSSIYLGLNTGINNHNGMLGLSLEKTLGSQFSAGVGVGLSSWGYKFFGEGRYYFQENCHRKTALGIGITRSTGGDNITLSNVETNQGKKDLLLDMNPATNGFVSIYRFWTIGKKYNKFYTHVGFSFAIEKASFSIDQSSLNTNPGIALNTNAINSLNSITPGGFIIGVGWYFGLD